MFDNYKDKILERLHTHIINNYKPIKVKSGKGMFNNRCQLNTVHEVECGDMLGVVMCLCIEKTNSKNIILHFVNIDNNGDYLDNTLGYLSSKYNYYKMRDVEESDYYDMGNLLITTKKYLIELFSNKIMRYLSKTNYKII